MNKYIKHWSVAACAALTLTAAFSSCSKDSESVEELMERNYPARVYLQGDRYSAPALTHTLKHSSDGIEGELGGSVTVRLTRPQAQDVVVSLKSTLDKRHRGYGQGGEDHQRAHHLHHRQVQARDEGREPDLQGQLLY